MEKRKILAIFILFVFAIVGAGACRSAKNTGVAIKEGTTEAVEETAEAAEHAGKKVEDGTITAAIKMKFANDEMVSASNIDVDTNQGDVTLNGVVSTRAEADRAAQLAQSVDGVKSVHSNLVVQQEVGGK